MNKVETYNRKNKISQIDWLIKIVRYLLNKEESGGDTGIQSIQDGNGTDINNTDPNNPIINILEVSASQKGIVNNTPLQELGGVDKLINEIRIGKGEGNISTNTVVGRTALESNTTGTQNTALGRNSLRYNTVGMLNTAIGVVSLGANISGNYNVGVGSNSLSNTQNGTHNTAIGTGALNYGTNITYNTALGYNAGININTGIHNTLIGNHSGYTNGLGNYNVAVGSRSMVIQTGSTSPSVFSMSNNVVVGSNISVPDSTNNILAIDNKGATNTLYSNALLYGNFADRFLRINGRFEIAPSTMPVADVGFTKKLVWNPTTGVVGEADDAPASVQQFVQITEGSNTGWGLKYRADNPDYYNSIGNRAIDMTYSNVTPTVGVSGLYSVLFGHNNTELMAGGWNTISGGRENAVSTSYSTISGGRNNTILESYSTISGGDNNETSRLYSTISGGASNTANGVYSTISGGYNNTANSYAEWVGGVFGTIPTGQNPTSFVASDRLFNIGNGTSTSLRSDAFTILKNGLVTLPSVTNALIDAEPTGKAVATKEWVLANSGGSTPTLQEVMDSGSYAMVETGDPVYIGVDMAPLTLQGYFGLNILGNSGININSSGSGISLDGQVFPTNDGTNGQVLTTNGSGVLSWEDVEVQTYLQSITGYDAGATQTLKNVAGTLTWVTDTP